jgi:hypothetical protein
MAEVNVLPEAVTEAVNQQLLGAIANINVMRLSYYRTYTLPDWKRNVEQNRALGIPIEKWDPSHRNPPEPPKVAKPGPVLGGGLRGLIGGWVEGTEYLTPPEPAPTEKPKPVDLVAIGPQFGPPGYGGYWGANPLDGTPDGTEAIAPDGTLVWKKRTAFGWFWQPVSERLRTVAEAPAGKNHSTPERSPRRKSKNLLKGK